MLLAEYKFFFYFNFFNYSLNSFKNIEIKKILVEKTLSILILEDILQRFQNQYRYS